jgi:hypothetical protein
MKTGQRVTLENLKNIEGGYCNTYNPQLLEGTVINVNGKFNPIEVRWDNGIRNSYYKYNLKIVE